jgi:hypothetical protein
MDRIPDEIDLQIISHLLTATLAGSVAKVRMRLSNMASDCSLWINPDICIEQVRDSPNN